MKIILTILALLTGCGDGCRHGVAMCQPISIGNSMVVAYQCKEIK